MNNDFIYLNFGIALANWQNLGGDLQHSGYVEGGQIVPLNLIWNYKVGSSDISAPIIDSGIIFVGSDDDNLYAISATTGELMWKYSAHGKVYTPTAKNGMVFAGSYDNNIYALDYKGNLKWIYDAGNSVISPPISYNNILYGGYERNVYAIDVASGNLVWKHAVDGIIESTPAISQGLVYIGSEDDNIYALNSENGNIVWKYKTSGSISSSPSVINGNVYIGSNDNNLYAIDSSGNLKWSKSTGDWIKSSPAGFDNRVYIGSNDQTIYAFDSNNGDAIWSFRTDDWIESSPIILDNIVYIGSDDGTIYVLDAEKGGLKTKYTVGNKIISLALSDNMLFATSNNGYLYAFGIPTIIPTSTPSTMIITPTAISTSVPTPKTVQTTPELVINHIPPNVTSDNITISGTANSPNGILVVTVNGISTGDYNLSSGNYNWSTRVYLSKGSNIITIVAVDKAGNIKTEFVNVNYIPQEKNIPGFEIKLGIIIIIMLYIIRKQTENRKQKIESENRMVESKKTE